jgi:hypothetical protein
LCPIVEGERVGAFFVIVLVETVLVETTLVETEDENKYVFSKSIYPFAG